MTTEDKPSTATATAPITQTEQKAAGALTVLWNDIPTWLQDSHYIHSGYRPASNSYRESFASLTYLHNETVNIWTHLVGACLAAIAAIVLYTHVRPRYEMATSEDVMVFACYFLGAVTCLGMSATYHLICNHSEAVAKFGNRLDYMGIIFLIWGSFIPSLYYGFDAELRKHYWSMITTIAAGTLAVVMLPKFRSPEWRPFRAFMFAAMGLSAVIPVVHGLQLYGSAQLEKQMGLSWVVTQGVLYILGAAIYAIFHVLVLLAATAHLVGLLKAFDYEHRYRSGLMSAYSAARKLGGPV
ncbi:hypothetical protein LTR57_005006 [Friedmanniomyces endolithicus]|uniref:Hemolysin-III channel protein Izh2 n=1 Tax=Friedmanniomyces endolithicus TaxID=329885 RepID=A0AAN6G1R0_9PEZI|nr:hypothetical protein LTR82_000396 [Friedmanniomyces endolithicus]KAK0925355.1 hypothetical protein LTR57_005006 [Friedmanniomyces endolithicus]KAK0984844.1 hypothetical protein LTR54_013964 [Friedmanniomyces endolithicus]